MRKLLLVILFLLAAFPAEAALQTTELSVDVTAENAAVAREKAMNQATRQAVYNTAASFTGADGLQLLNQMRHDQLLNFIVETTVLEEKSSNIRYMARLQLVVDATLLKQYLQEKDIPVSAASMPDILVIPVFRPQPTDTALLWEDNNAWRAAWIAYGQKNGLGKIRLLPPDMASVISAAPTTGLDTAAIQAISTRFGKTAIYIADAAYNGNVLDVRLTNATTGKTENFSQNGELSDELFNQSIAEVVQNILRSQSQNQMMIISDQVDTIGVLATFGTLQQWLQTENTIRNLTPVQDVRVQAAGNGRVQFQIDFSGGLPSLNRAMNEASFTLEPNGNFYILSRH